MIKNKDGFGIFPKFTKDWEKDLDGGETSAELIIGKCVRIGTYKAKLRSIFYDGNKIHAIILFKNKDSHTEMCLFECERYDLQDGYCIDINRIIQKPEDRVHLNIKKKTQ